MRSSALAGFLASALVVSGSAGFASTFVVGPYLGAHLRHQPVRTALMATAAPIDPLVALQLPGTSVAAGLEGEPPASQTAHRPRNVENTPAPLPVTTVATAPAASPASDASTGDMQGPVTEESFVPTAPNTIASATGGPLIATETTSAMVSSKLENGEPVLTLRIAPVVAASAPGIDSKDPDNAVEPTIISAPPSEQALATPAVSVAPAAMSQPTPAPIEPQHSVTIHPRVKPALTKVTPPEEEPAPRRSHSRTPVAPARVTTTAKPAQPPESTKLPAAGELQPIGPSTDLNAPFLPATSPASPPPAPSPAPAATGSPSQTAPTGGPTPLVMPQ